MPYHGLSRPVRLVRWRALDGSLPRLPGQAAGSLLGDHGLTSLSYLGRVTGVTEEMVRSVLEKIAAG